MPLSQVPNTMNENDSYFATGDLLATLSSAARTGWILGDGRTIGDASSGATNRANADTLNLYTLLWNAYADSICPVSTGRGASAAADFAAHKTIQILDFRGRSISFKDNMGGTTAGRLTTAGGGVDGVTLGASGGTETHTLTAAQMPSHSHTATYDGTSGINTASNRVMTTSGGNGLGTFTSSTAGSGGAHPNVHPTIVLNAMIKL